MVICGMINTLDNGRENKDMHFQFLLEDKSGGILIKATPHKCQKPHYTVGAK